jgi:hypothetical protein
VFYIFDEFKNIAPKMYKALPTDVNKQAEDQKQREEENKDEDDGDQQQQRKPPQGPQQRSKFAKIFKNEGELTQEQEEDFKKFEKDRMQSITNEVVEYYPRLMLFHSLVVTFCAIRSPTDTAVVLTYFAIILRIVMVFGWYCKRRFVYMSTGVAEALINIILFFITLIYTPY